MYVNSQLNGRQISTPDSYRIEYPNYKWIVTKNFLLMVLKELISKVGEILIWWMHEYISVVFNDKQELL